MTILIVDEDAAAGLVTAGIARRRPSTRSGISEWLTDAGGATSACIAILQLPAVVKWYAAWVRERAAKRPSNKISLTLKGPRGEISLIDVRGTDELASIVQLIQAHVDSEAE